MSRRVLLNLDLRGQVLDASLEPDGHARESLVQGCTFDANTRFLGDIRGSDFLANNGPADWSGAETYACCWRRNTNMMGSQFPADIGFLHHQPVIEIIRQGIAALNPPAAVRTKLEAVRQHVMGGGSWATSPLYWWEGLTLLQRERLRDAWRRVFTGYPSLADRFEDLLRDLLAGKTSGAPHAIWQRTLTWPDGAEVTIDAANLPPLPELSRYALARWAEAEADAQRPTDTHHCFVYSVAEPLIPLTAADVWRTPTDWFEQRRAGY